MAPQQCVNSIRRKTGEGKKIFSLHSWMIISHSPYEVAAHNRSVWESWKSSPGAWVEVNDPKVSNGSKTNYEFMINLSSAMQEKWKWKSCPGPITKKRRRITRFYTKRTWTSSIEAIPSLFVVSLQWNLHNLMREWSLRWTWFAGWSIRRDWPVFLGLLS